MSFKNRYSKLNTRQRAAVDHIDGPLMVVAGPGTGKTELLSIRIANILQKTDTLPENILCLTFTDSGAQAMRDRLSDIIGKDAYRVAVHTFHSFGVEVINQNSDFFYGGANYQAADEISSYKILRKIFEELDHTNPLISQQNGEYVFQPDVARAISELKRSGLISDELNQILDENDLVISKCNRLISPIFEKYPRINKKTAKEIVAELISIIEEIRQIGDKPVVKTVVPLSEIIADSIQKAIYDSVEIHPTKPITTWKNAWLAKDENNKFILKSTERQRKLRAVSFIYDRYINTMHEAALYDYDDMILRVVHSLDLFENLRYNLQEKYQYILVDEFQDTNMAQMRILHNLTDNEIAGDTPNIMVVGDDDQAIYSFQGADVGNIIDFQKHYPKTKRITLTDNYRSNADILSRSRDIITQGSQRLENIFEDINKQLTAHKDQKGESELYEAQTIQDERNWLVNHIKQQIESGISPNEIAVLTRKHDDIEKLLPYFAKSNIKVSYEKQDNVLDLEIIKTIISTTRLITAIADNRHQAIDELLPEILSHSAFNFAPVDLWKLSLKSYQSQKSWMEIMSLDDKYSKIHDWLINLAAASHHEPLEKILDEIVGKDPEPDTFNSPLFAYYFDQKIMQENAEKYIEYLDALKTIRSHLREYMPNQDLKIQSFIEYVDLCHKTNTKIRSRQKISLDQDAITLMTAHKSKGLEYNTIYIFDAIDTKWGEKTRSVPRKINYPENLPLAPAGDTFDERLRLFYVAATRAKKDIFISYSLMNDSQKATRLASFLTDSNWEIKPIESVKDPQEVINQMEISWRTYVTEPINKDMSQVIRPLLLDYKLSATHLNNFLDVSRGGPQYFLLNNLLHFPQSKNASAAFGSAIHETLQQAHNMFSASDGKQLPIEDLVAVFDDSLKKQRLDQKDYIHYSQKGGDVLRQFFNAKYDSFKTNDKAEISFSNQHSIVDEAHLTGKLDLMSIDQSDKTISVTDYKTGKASNSWKGFSEYEKIKLHKYQQQLMFYKLLIENSRDYHNYSVKNGIMQFVEPTKSDKIIDLEYDFNGQEMDNFKKLVNAVWQKIINFNLPDTSQYPENYAGILQFEKDLINDDI